MHAWRAEARKERGDNRQLLLLLLLPLSLLLLLLLLMCTACCPLHCARTTQCQGLSCMD